MHDVSKCVFVYLLKFHRKSNSSSRISISIVIMNSIKISLFLRSPDYHMNKCNDIVHRNFAQSVHSKYNNNSGLVVVRGSFHVLVTLVQPYRLAPFHNSQSPIVIIVPFNLATIDESFNSTDTVETCRCTEMQDWRYCEDPSCHSGYVLRQLLGKNAPESAVQRNSGNF